MRHSKECRGNIGRKRGTKKENIVGNIMIMTKNTDIRTIRWTNIINGQALHGMKDILQAEMKSAK